LEFGEESMRKPRIFKVILMGDSCGSKEAQHPDRNMDHNDCVNEVSDGSKDSIRIWTMGHSCFILAKNLSTFCPCLEVLREAEFKSDGSSR
jgi:hypothetical protein